jgi:hypothetical protein
VLHKYVDPPLAVREELPPLQIVAGAATAVIVGNGFTVTVTDAVLVHPAAEVPVTVYVVVVAGLTDKGLAEEPVLHKYVDPPLAVREELPPLQIVAGAATAVIVGLGLTVTVIDAVLVHPAAEVPVTVYVVVVAGLTDKGLAEEPVLHKYVDPPLAVREELPPLQIVAGAATAVIVGNGFTVTVTDAVLVHPAAEVPVTVYVVVAAGLTDKGLAVEPVLHK